MTQTSRTPAADHQQESIGTAQLRRRSQSKLDLIAERLRGPLGATLEELMVATSWQSHSVRAGMTGLRKQGHSVVRMTDNGITRFAIAAPATASEDA